MGTVNRRPLVSVAGPTARDLPELLHECAQTRVTRLHMAGGSVVRKQPLGPERERRLRHEQAILHRLTGVPGVGQLSPIPTWPGSLFLTDIGGRSLASMATPLAVEQVVRLALELARTLAAVHGHGILHRNICPANILLTEAEDTPYLIDFALATTFAEIRPEFTHHREIVGSMPYLAPEQSGRTARPVDQRADLYALGSTLYELATGEPPFGSGDPLRLSHDHLTRVPTPPVEVRPAVGTALSDVIMHLLEKEPDSRYQTADGLVHDLSVLQDGPMDPDDFHTGAHDFPARLLLSSRIVGRDREITALGSAFALAMDGRCRGVLISGAPGIGKTSLINELRPIVTTANGWFVAGKFDPYRWDQEFDAVWQVFQTLGRLLLAEPEDVLADLRGRLRPTLGPDAGLIAALHPEFGTLLQAEPDPAIGDPMTLPDRLARIRIEILRQVASPGRPIVIAIDDLQWAGHGPLDFLDRLLSEGGHAGLLLVAAYREDQVNGAHPLAAALARWRLREVHPQSLRLTNLTPAGEATLLADLLRLTPERATELAALTRPHTGGNPYTVIDLLSSLRHEGLLLSDREGWRWESAALLRRLATVDVTALLISRAESLPAASEALLQTMACLGGRAELHLLAIALAASPAQVEESLRPALHEGLLVMEPSRPDAVRFHHDHVQEVILSRLPPQHALRLRLARRLATVPGLFAVAAEQYLVVIDSVREPPERRQVTALLRRCAEQAQLTGNYALVERCMAAAEKLTDPHDTTTMITLLTSRHAALYRLGRLAEADQVYTRLDQLCDTAIARVDATLVQMSSLSNRKQPQAAVRLGQDLLCQLGHPLPAPEQLSTEIDRGLAELYRWIEQYDQSPEVDRPVVTDPLLLATGAVINRMLPPSYFCDERLMVWLILRAWRIWMTHGPLRGIVGPVSHLPYLTAYQKDHHAGYRAMRRVLATSAAHGYEPETSQARFLYAFGSWRIEPIEDCLRHGRRAQEGLSQEGDLQNLNTTYYLTTSYLQEYAPSLDDVLTELDAGLALAQRTGNEGTAETFRIHRQMLLILQGEAGVRTLGGLGPAERYHDNPPAAASLHLAHALIAALFGDLNELVDRTAALVPLQPALTGTYPSALVHFLRALACAERVRTAPAGAHCVEAAELDQTIDLLASYAADAPANFLHLLRLAEAERAWAKDDFRAASYAYDAATREVMTRQRPWHRALILERAGRFHLAHGMEHIGYTRLADARQAYHNWGATAKVDQLRWGYPTRRTMPATRIEPAAGPVGEPASRSDLSSGAFDLLGILAGSQALSSETSIDGLRARVVDVLSTMTGATKVQLLLWSDDERTWLVTAPGGGDDALIPLRTAGCRVPVSAVRYAERTGEPLVVSDATRDDRFARDPYLAGLSACSLLVVPIRNRGVLQGLLVLENRLIRGAFTTERLDGVTLIAGQLAVSLHNAMIYSSMERKVAERTEALACANERLERLSITDALTDLANRRRLEEVLRGEWQRARRSSAPVALAMIDIDHFKAYNDRYGHVAGDRCLQRVATLLGRHARDADLAARYGGEEFAIVMPATELDTALTAAERLRAAVEALEEPNPLVTEGVVTVSVGVAAMVPPLAGPVGRLAETADTELYRAKRSGRNRVMPGLRASVTRVSASGYVPDIRRGEGTVG